MASAPSNQSYYLLKEFGRKCLENSSIITENVLENTSYCPTYFDGLMCWKKAKAGEIVQQSCSSNDYIVSTYNGVATLSCEKSGKWFTLYENLEATANYSQCGTFYTRRLSSEEDIYIYWLPIIRKCTHVGYIFSIVSLVSALIIFTYFKRLHCARNYLHMHLFISSIMRCLMSIAKDILSDRGITLYAETSEEQKHLVLRKETFWFCKAIISLRQYFILTNYVMLLMEGVYLHNLIFLRLFSDKTSVKIYALTGWILPLLFVIPWCTLRIRNGSVFCWTKKDETSLLIDIPTGVIVLINFILFVLIVRVLCLKLNSIFIQQRKVKYRKLLKATLILLPLFGVPYTMSIIISFYVSHDKTLEIVWLFFDQSFTAFQGFLAALSYCLLNGDVQTEVKRRYHSMQDKHELRRCRTISHTLQSFFPNGEEFTEVPQCAGDNGKFETAF